MNVDYHLFREIQPSDRPTYSFEAVEYFGKSRRTRANESFRVCDLTRLIKGNPILKGIFDSTVKYSNLSITCNYKPGFYWVRNLTATSDFWPLGGAYRAKSNFSIRTTVYLDKVNAPRVIILKSKIKFRVVKAWNICRASLQINFFLILNEWMNFKWRKVCMCCYL